MQNALSSTSMYVNWWCHLDSIRHVLAKILDPDNKTPLNELDRERLEALIELVKGIHASSESVDPLSEEFLAKLNEPEAAYTPDVDFEECFRSSKRFNEWQKASKIGFEKKTQKLLAALENYVTSSKDQLIPRHAPHEEFRVLKDVVEKLLTDAQFLLGE